MEPSYWFQKKGKKPSYKKGRKRGTKAKKRRISNGPVAVIVTANRTGQLEMSVSTLGRIMKSDIEKSLSSRNGRTNGLGSIDKTPSTTLELA